MDKEQVFEHQPPSKEEYLRQQKELASLSLESYVYQRYSRDKQQQDAGWVNYYRTALAGAGVDGLDARILSAHKAVVGGDTVDNAMESFVAGLDEQVVDALGADYLAAAATKLLKVGARMTWAKACIDEGQAAFTEGRNPVWQEFPVFE